MMKKLLYGAFIGALLALCLSLSVGVLVAGPSRAAANEKLSAPAQLLTEEGTLNLNYLDHVESWFNDHFFLRQELISLEHWLTGSVLQTSAEPTVILGSEGWLYYPDTLDDYTGLSPMTDRELFIASRNLALMNEYCRENGKQFVFMIAPNKNSLYGQFMPHYGMVAELTDADRLLQRLAEAEVPTVDLFTAFAGQEEILYFAHDSHWNSKGAALGADLVNQAFGVESQYFAGDFSQSTPHAGDLYGMLYPAFTDPETDPVYGGQLAFTFTSKATRPDAIVLTTESGASGNLLAYRDSFGMLLFPYLADSYGTAKFSRSNNYDLTGEADYVLIELVERNLCYLYQYLPVMEAPVRALELPESTCGTISVESTGKNQLIQYSGAVPALDDASCIYAVSDGVVYEAFCLENNGFGINLPEGAGLQYVICTVNGALVMYEVQ